jgi:hypothetical protein
MSIHCLLDRQSPAKYILVHSGERVRFVRFDDLCKYCDKQFGENQYSLQFDYADEWM